MEAHELRKGNIVQLYSFWGKKWVDPMPITAENIYLIDKGELDCRPVPLTEDWLLKFGFEYAMFPASDSDGVYRDKKAPDKNYFKHPELSDKITIYLPYFNVSYYIGDVTVKYVHQLQNLFYALTGTELPIKDPVLD